MSQEAKPKSDSGELLPKDFIKRSMILIMIFLVFPDSNNRLNDENTLSLKGKFVPSSKLALYISLDQRCSTKLFLLPLSRQVFAVVTFPENQGCYSLDFTVVNTLF